MNLKKKENVSVIDEKIDEQEEHTISDAPFTSDDHHDDTTKSSEQPIVIDRRTTSTIPTKTVNLRSSHVKSNPPSLILVKPLLVYQLAQIFFRTF